MLLSFTESHPVSFSSTGSKTIPAELQLLLLTLVFLTHLTLATDLVRLVCHVIAEIFAVVRYYKSR